MSRVERTGYWIAMNGPIRALTTMATYKPTCKAAAVALQRLSKPGISWAQMEQDGWTLCPCVLGVQVKGRRGGGDSDEQA